MQSINKGLTREKESLKKEMIDLLKEEQNFEMVRLNLIENSGDDESLINYHKKLLGSIEKLKSEENQLMNELEEKREELKVKLTPFWQEKLTGYEEKLIEIQKKREYYLKKQLTISSIISKKEEDYIAFVNKNNKEEKIYSNQMSNYQEKKKSLEEKYQKNTEEIEKRLEMKLIKYLLEKLDLPEQKKYLVEDLKHGNFLKVIEQKRFYILSLKQLLRNLEDIRIGKNVTEEVFYNKLGIEKDIVEVTKILN